LPSLGEHPGTWCHPFGEAHHLKLLEATNQHRLVGGSRAMQRANLHPLVFRIRRRT